MTETTFDQDPFADRGPAHERVLLISESAAKRLADMIAREQDPSLLLRVTVSGGGCSGYQYGFSFDSGATPDDLVFERDGVRVVTDSVSMDLLAGSEVDYKDELVGSYFAINNPNASSSCGCGTSFSL
ncbi:MAG: iron-sulfur cluster insertion protein ErpA [Alphaproteobacteria bacterium]|nr:iron-sulfur cluster insertion protein ErpA [Alphaproteobacteria bacterium]